MLCTVYIHDADMKTEILVRRALLMSGAAYTNHVRFTNDINSADLWVIQQDNSFIKGAEKYQSEGTITVWMYDKVHQLFDIHQPQQALSASDVAEFIDAIVSQTQTHLELDLVDD